MSSLLDPLVTIRDMTTALRSLTPDYLDRAEMRLAAYRLFTNADGDDMRRFDQDALTAERARRTLFPAPVAPQLWIARHENSVAASGKH